MKRLLVLYKRQVFLLLTILVLSLVLSQLSSRFLTVNNIANILNTNAITGIMALGMMLVITTGNIDRSVGAQFAATGMVVALVAKATGGNHVILILLAGVGTGILFGLVNGFFVTKLRIPAIIVTIGTFNIIRGSLYVITNGNMIQNLKAPFTEFAVNRIGAFTVASYVWLLLIILTFFLVNKTIIGRNILAVGGNIIAAERIGLKPSSVHFFVYAFMGAMSGIAAFLNVSKLSVATPTAGGGYEMTLIAAAVIGGTSFAGGIASVFGTVLGVLLLGVIYNGLVLVKVPIYWQDLVTGFVIIFALITSVPDLLKNLGIHRTIGKRGKL